MVGNAVHSSDDVKVDGLVWSRFYWCALLAFLALMVNMFGWIGSVGLAIGLVLFCVVLSVLSPVIEPLLGRVWPWLRWLLIGGAILGLLFPFITGALAMERGIASVYSSRESHGAPACSKVAKVMDDRALVAAHKALPCGSRVKVTNTKTGASVVVMIIDRGPFVRGRVIDLSPAAAGALGFKGLVPVTLEVVS